MSALSGLEKEIKKTPLLTMYKHGSDKDYAVVELTGNVDLMEDHHGIVFEFKDFKLFGDLKDLSEVFEGMDGDVLQKGFVDRYGYSEKSIPFSIGRLSKDNMLEDYLSEGTISDVKGE